ncbi:MAG: GNAT family N-acetyltransferase [Butyrivibrio sp.]|nr:GNAT family N-acetyltransferase [Butyrivibrio sp.]
MLYLKKANYEDIEKEYDYITNTPEEENGFTNPYSGIDFETFKNKIIPRYIDYDNEINMDENHVPQTEFFLWEDEKIVGLFHVRHYLNDFLAAGAGHIGYGIRKEYRGKGYATEGLKLAIEELKKLIREDKIYMSVNKDNPASLKVQKNNGAYIVGENDTEFFTRIDI